MSRESTYDVEVGPLLAVEADALQDVPCERVPMRTVRAPAVVSTNASRLKRSASFAAGVLAVVAVFYLIVPSHAKSLMSRATSYDMIKFSNRGGTVYIIRHGEKTALQGCLNAKGASRAANLINVFNGQPSPKHPIFQPPRSIFAHWYHDNVDCERCNQTAAPISSALGIPIDMTHGGGHPGSGPNGGNKAAAAAILKKLKATGGPVLVAWEHLNIKYLTEALGVKWSRIPPWPEYDYDTIYVLEFDKPLLNFWSHDIGLVNFWSSHQNFALSDGGVWPEHVPATKWV